MHDDGFLPAPAPLVRERWSMWRVLRSALVPNFSEIHAVPDEELRRVAFVSLLAGGAFVFLGMIVARWLIAWTGLGLNKAFLFVAGYGGAVAGIGAYRLGVSIFPALKSETRLASLARMFFVLIVLSMIGAIVMYALIGE